MDPTLEQQPSIAAASPAASAAPPTLNHPPPYAEMIYAAITALKKKDGSSKIAIGKYIEQTYLDLPANHSTLLTQHLLRLKNTGHLLMVKKSYKLSETVNISSSSSDAAVPKLKQKTRRRPVGRPRKVQVQAQPTAIAKSQVQAQVHRTRRSVGRPKKDEVVSQRQSSEHDVRCLRRELQQVKVERDRQESQVQALTKELDLKERQLTAANEKSEHDVGCIRRELQEVRDDRDRQASQVQALKAEFDAANEKLKMFEREFLEGQRLVKQYLNTIVELKRNIRVLCRVRPMLPHDCAGQEASPISYPTSMDLRGRGIEVLYKGMTRQFKFNKVLSHTASQQDVFGEVSELVQCALDGHKVCIFAYGQTGSGKSYTMMGIPESLEHKGLIPRSIEQIFQISQVLAAQGWKFNMQASIFEVYNKKIKDLMVMNQSTGSASVRKKQRPVKGSADDQSTTLTLDDFTIADVSSIEQIFSLLQRAIQARSVGKTQMNEQSSRSHLVFTLHISRVHEGTGQQVQGVLNLTDLAGNERVGKSKVVGEQPEETKAINLSLKSLSDVINALVKKHEHVPYRDSVLTHVLQPYLGKDAKTLMVVNITPTRSSVEETMTSMRFASTAFGSAAVTVQQKSLLHGDSSRRKSPRWS